MCSNKQKFSVSFLFLQLPEKGGMGGLRLFQALFTCSTLVNQVCIPVRILRTAFIDFKRYF